MAKPEFFTENGVVKPVTPPKPKWPGQILGAAVVAVAVSAGGTVSIAGTAGSIGTVGTAGSTGSAGTAGSVGLRTSVNVGGAQLRPRFGNAGRVKQRLLRGGFGVDGEVSFDGADCAAYSYGRVQQFFRDQPCVELHRALLEVRDPRVGLVLVSVAWIDMPDLGSARRLQELLATPGSGGVVELAREGEPARAARSAIGAGVSIRDGNLVVVARAEPVGAAAVAAELTELADTVAREAIRQP